MQERDHQHDEIWRSLMVDGMEKFNRGHKLLSYLPSNPRCRFCGAPFDGPGSVVARVVFGRAKSALNPQICNVCEKLATDMPGGVEIELSMLFADIRGSTTLAEKMTPSQFTHLINRFYSVATDILSRGDGLINRFVGDEVVAFFVPGVAGKAHAHKALEAAKKLLHATGNTPGSTPWAPIGIGLHIGVAYVGAVGGSGSGDFTALGDPVNVAARLASNAGAGEILASDALCKAASLSDPALEHRDLALKGREERVGVYVLKV